MEMVVGEIEEDMIEMVVEIIEIIGAVIEVGKDIIVEVEIGEMVEIIEVEIGEIGEIVIVSLEKIQKLQKITTGGVRLNNIYLCNIYQLNITK